MKTHFIRHLFVTLTYARDRSILQTQQQCSKDYNRYIQKLRRLHHTKIQYLRTIENHKDGYPHFHVLLQFPRADIRVENDRYFSKILYSKWKSSWTHGLSDIQVPRRNGVGQISYILKYITKNATSKTIWKKLYQTSAKAVDTETSIPLDQNTLDASVPFLHSAATSITSTSITSPIHTSNGVKLCTWSRGFDFSPFFFK